MKTPKFVKWSALSQKELRSIAARAVAREHQFVAPDIRRAANRALQWTHLDKPASAKWVRKANYVLRYVKELWDERHVVTV